MQSFECKLLLCQKDGQRYLIDNNAADADVKACIDEAYKNSYIQELYKSVNDDIEACVQKDEQFAKFYSKIQESGQ